MAILYRLQDDNTPPVRPPLPQTQRYRLREQGRSIKWLCFFQVFGAQISGNVGSRASLCVGPCVGLVWALCGRICDRLGFWSIRRPTNRNRIIDMFSISFLRNCESMVKPGLGKQGEQCATHGHGHGPWPMAHGARPWSTAHGPRPKAHGLGPMARDHGPWPVSAAMDHGRRHG